MVFDGSVQIHPDRGNHHVVLLDVGLNTPITPVVAAGALSSLEIMVNDVRVHERLSCYV